MMFPYNFDSNGGILTVEKYLDNEKELEITIESRITNMEATSWINKEKSILLIDHLQTAFNIPKPQVWYGRIPESNGKSNWTVILHTGDVYSGFTVHHSEYPDRARYDADELKYLLGIITDKPDLMTYDGDLVSPPYDWK